MKSSLYILILLFTTFCVAQTIPSESIKGIWINGKTGISVENDKFVLLEKKPTWAPVKSNDAVYYYLEEPLTNDEKKYEIWVYNKVKRKIITSDDKGDSITKKYRIIKFELQKNGKLKLAISGFIVKSQSNPTEYWLHQAWSTDRTEFNFKRLPEK